MGPDEVPPGSGAGVAVRDQGHPLRPGDRQIGVVVGDRDVFPRIVRAVDAVADIRNVGERLEAVQKSRRHVQLPKLVVVQEESLLLPEARRFGPNIHQHIVDGTVRTAHQLGLTATRAPVHAAHHAPDGPGLRILDEGGGRAGHTPVRVEFGGVEGAGEQTPVVPEGLRGQHQDVGELGRIDAHQAMVP